MLYKSRFFATGSLGLLATLGAVALPTAASATQVIVNLGTSFASTPASFNFEGSTFTFSATGDFFFPTAIQTSGGGAVRTVFGSPSTDFPDRGSGILNYGPGLTYASFPTKTTIPYSNGNNYLGLRATLNGVSYYGYAFTTNTTLNSFGFETTPNTAFVINTSTAAVPETASWAMFIGGFGSIGAVTRRRKAKVSFA